MARLIGEHGVRILTIGEQPDLPETYINIGLKKLGFEICSMLSQKSGAIAPLREASIETIPLDLRSRFDIAAMLKIRATIKAFRPEIVTSYTNRALQNALFASISLPGKHVGYRGTVGHLSRFDPSSWMTYLNPRVSSVMCLSNAVRQYLVDLGIPSQRLRTIYKGQDPNWYTGGSSVELSTFGIPAGSVVVSMSANMRRIKGADILIEAIGLLPDLERLHLLLIGEVRDDLVTRSYEKVKHLGRVHLVGYRSNAASLVKASDIFVMPSRAREGLCKAVQEAMIQGVAPIVSNVGGMPELIVDQVSGIVVPPSDPQKLADAIRSLYLDDQKRKAMGQAARDRILENFPVDRAINETAQLYRDLLGQSAAA